MPKRTDECLRAPVPKRSVIDQALAAWCPSRGLDHIGLHGGFVDKSKPLQMVGHERLALRDPDAAQIGHVLAFLLKRLQVFFVTEAKPVQQPPDRGAMDFKPMLRTQLCRQVVNRQIRPRSDLGAHPILGAREFAVSGIALRLRLKRSGLALEAHHVVDEFDRNAQVPGRLCVRVSLLNNRDSAFP